MLLEDSFNGLGIAVDLKFASRKGLGSKESTWLAHEAG